MVATTQLRLALETEEERRAKKWTGFDLNLIWIEIGVLKIQGMSPLTLYNGSHFSNWRASEASETLSGLFN